MSLPKGSFHKASPGKPAGDLRRLPAIARRAKGGSGKPAKDDFRSRKPQRHKLKGELSIRTHMHYVYLIRSITEPQQTYIGLTSDLQARMKKHNAGGSPHTAKYKPWALISYHTFNSREKAAAFEQYSKTGSGRAFAKRHLW